ncbi:MAG: hypothetical protein PHV35_11250, partial [Mariniphaga sp.]|nr:hypothetical protein [Mariniphaga sp.]
MKRILQLLVLIFTVNFSLGQPVSREQAIKVASNFLFGSPRAVKQNSFYTNDKKSGIYVINFKP